MSNNQGQASQKSMRQVSTFIFRVGRVEGKKKKAQGAIDMSGKTSQQLTLGEYYNTRKEDRKAGARLHWGQHNFFKGMFYAFQYGDGTHTSSFSKDKELTQHVDISVNYEFEQILPLVTMLKEYEERLCRPDVDSNKVALGQDQLQLHVKVYSDSMVEVFEYFGQKKQEVDRITIRLKPADIVEWKLVKASDEEFIGSVGGVSVGLDTVMEALFGKSNQASTNLSTSEDIRNHFKTDSSSKRRRTRKKSTKQQQQVNEIVKVSSEIQTTEPKPTIAPTGYIDCSEELDDIPA